MQIDYSSCTVQTGSIVLECTDGTSTLTSNAFVFDTSCDLTSTTITIPTEFRSSQTYYYIIDGNLPQIPIPSFTSSFSPCPITNLETDIDEIVLQDGELVLVDPNQKTTQATYELVITATAEGGITAVSQPIEFIVTTTCTNATIELDLEKV